LAKEVAPRVEFVQDGISEIKSILRKGTHTRSQEALIQSD